MGEKSPVVVGIEIKRTPGRLSQPFVFTALDEDRKLLAISSASLEDLLAYLGGQQFAHVAINAPRSPNNGAVLQGIANQAPLSPDEPTKPAKNRLCETLLAQQGFPNPGTPGSPTACPGWMRRGFKLYHALENYGYHPNPEADGGRYALETLADAVFWRLMNRKLPLLPSLEGRLQRQLILLDAGLPIPDAMTFFDEVTRFKLIQGELPDEAIFTIEELNALTASFIAWQAAFRPNHLERLGDIDEGQIILPNSKPN